MKPIIKSKKRYKLIKFPKGLDLNNYKTILRSGESGASTIDFGDKWFVTPHGKGLFKTYDINENGLRIINELLYDELAHQVGLPVAKYLPAEYKSYPISYMLRIDKDQIEKPDPEKIYNGLVSIDVTKQNERIFSGEDLLSYDGFYGNYTFTDYLKALDYFKEQEGYYVDKQGIKSSLYKMMVLDALTFMQDRNEYNVSFIRNDKDAYIVESPILDNEMCFAGYSLFYRNEDFSDVNLDEFLEIHARGICMYVNEVDAKAPMKDRYAQTIKELIKLANKNKNMKNILDNTLEKLDINSAIENVEKMGYEVTPEYKSYVKNLIGLSKSMFKKYIKEYNKKQEEKAEETL